MVAILAVIGCGGPDVSVTSRGTEGGSSVSTASTVADASARALRILVVNDDGVGAEGIDALARGLRSMANVEIIVVAPADNRSGSGSSSSNGDIVATAASTRSGIPAVAVAGYPVDAVVWAVDRAGIGFTPDLVVSGVNDGSNFSAEVIPRSGTIGAARAAAARGIASLAVSAGRALPTDFATAVDYALRWISANRDRLLSGGFQGGAANFWSMNVPTCPPGTAVRGLLAVTVEHLGGRDPSRWDCASRRAADSLRGDVEAFASGFATLSNLSVADLSSVATPVGAVTSPAG